MPPGTSGSRLFSALPLAFNSPFEFRSKRVAQSHRGESAASSLKCGSRSAGPAGKRTRPILAGPTPRGGVGLRPGQAHGPTDPDPFHSSARLTKPRRTGFMGTYSTVSRRPRHAINLRARWPERDAGPTARRAINIGSPGDGRPRLFPPKSQAYRAGLRHLLPSTLRGSGCRVGAEVSEWLFSSEGAI